MPRKKQIIVLICVGLIVAVLAAILITKAVRSSETYKRAEVLIRAGEYRKAVLTLNEIGNDKYKDTAALILLCNAHMEYDKGRYVDAYNTLNEAVFRHLSYSQRKSVNKFKSELKAEYEEYIEWQQEVDRQMIATGLPFVGMSESDINKTSLGRSSEYVHKDTETINGKVHLAYTYYFHKNGKLIFSARCVLGKVIEINDYRYQNSNSSTPRPHFSSSDPSVEGFLHPDDFYEYYRDDFFDFEEAEDYYYEHGGR